MSRRSQGPFGALGLLTALPVPSSARLVGAGVVRWFPLVGLILGIVAYAPAQLFWRGGPDGSPLLAAACVVAALAALTRGLHLDGLADLADGLGSGRPPAGAREVMRRSDVGPFGVVAVVLALLVQIAALATVFGAATRVQGLLAVAVAVCTGRVAIVLACAPHVPTAPGSALGTLVAGAASRTTRWVTVAGILAATALAGLATGLGPAWPPVAAALGLLAADRLRRHSVQRLGGVSGDVFGALAEVATSVTLLALAVEATWR